MTDTAFELYCEYVHCCGKKILKLGQTRDPKIAALWAETRNKSGKGPSLPPDDLIRTCPVRHCPAKLQVPRYGFQAMAGAGSAP